MYALYQFSVNKLLENKLNIKNTDIVCPSV